MLDAITDFWKPSKRSSHENALDVAGLQVGSRVQFGAVPQALLSNKTLTVTAINTYNFDGERLTSFVLSQEAEDDVSMIIAEAEGEKYLALSRRIPSIERMRMFETKELAAALGDAEIKRLNARNIDPNWKHWMVGSYKKEITGVKGELAAGDFRTFVRLPDDVSAKSFNYTLFVSDSNEYAIEAEQHSESRLELFATIYRRLSDISNILHAENDAPAQSKPVPKISSAVPATSIAAKLESLAKENTPAGEPVKEEPDPNQISMFGEESVSALPKTEALPSPFKPAPAEPTPIIESKPQTQPEKKPMAQFPVSPFAAPNLNKNEKNGAFKEQAAAYPEGKAVVSSQQPAAEENDSIECDLKVANKIIEEAIRNEMRLGDVVRRIIALPVANPEAVQIPVTLSEADFQLLGIRYGIAAANRDAIKSKIIEEMNDFSGKK